MLFVFVNQATAIWGRIYRNMILSISNELNNIQIVIIKMYFYQLNRVVISSQLYSVLFLNFNNLSLINLRSKCFLPALQTNPPLFVFFCLYKSFWWVYQLAINCRKKINFWQANFLSRVWQWRTLPKTCFLYLLGLSAN